MTQTQAHDLTLQELRQDMGVTHISDNSHLMPVATFTECTQAAALVATFGDRDLGKLSSIDQAALVLILSRLVYRDHIQKPVAIWEAAEVAIPEDEDETSTDMEAALELLEGIAPDDAIALIQFLVQ